MRSTKRSHAVSTVSARISCFAAATAATLTYTVLTIQGDASVTVEKANTGWKNFNGVDAKIKSVRWTDNGEELRFEQDGSDARIFATGFPYGTSLVVRVAEIETC